MSYILDAIKKAEKQRQVDQVPTLEASVAFQGERVSRFPWSKLFGWLLVITIVAALVWKYEPVTVVVLDKGKQAYSWVTGLLPSTQSQQSAESPAAGQLEGEQVVQQDIQQDEQPAPAAQSGSAATSVVGQVNQAPVEAEPESEPAPADTSAIADADRQRLGQVRLSVISYSSDANKRFIMEGSDLLREGDQLYGYPILEIRKNSILVDVHGTPWEVRLK